MLLSIRILSKFLCKENGLNSVKGRKEDKRKDSGEIVAHNNRNSESSNCKYLGLCGMEITKLSCKLTLCYINEGDDLGSMSKGETKGL